VLGLLTSRIRALASPAAPHGAVDLEKPSLADTRGAQRLFSTRSLADGAITVLSNGLYQQATIIAAFAIS